MSKEKSKTKKRKLGQENLKTIIQEVKNDDRFNTKSKKNITTVAKVIKANKKLTQKEINEIETNTSNSNTVHRIKNWEKKHNKPAKPGKTNLKTIIQKVKDDDRFNEESKKIISTVAKAIKDNKKLSQKEINEIENTPGNSNVVHSIKNWEKKHNKPAKPGKANLKTIIQEVKDDERFSEESKKTIEVVSEAIEKGKKLTQEQRVEIENNPSTSDTIYRIKQWEKNYKKPQTTFWTFLGQLGIIKLILFSLIWILLITAIVFLALGKAFGSPTAIILLFSIAGILLITYTLIGVKQLLKLRKENKNYDIKSPESISAWSAVFGFLLIPTIVSMVYDLIINLKKWHEWKKSHPKSTVNKNVLSRFVNKFLTSTTENHRVIKITLFILILISLVPTAIFIYLGRTFKYLHWMTTQKNEQKLWYAGFDIVVILSWIILGILLICYTLIGIKQLMDLRKENKKYNIKSPESISAWSAIFGFLLIPIIVSLVFDSILIHRHRKTSEYKAFKNKRAPLFGLYDITTMGILISLAVIFQIVSAKFIPQLPNGGSYFAAECIIAVIACIVLKWQSSLIVLIISPFIWWITKGATFSGPISAIFDYHLAYLVFAFMCLINPLNKLSIKWTNNKYGQLAITAVFGEILLALCFALKLLSHVVAAQYQLSTTWTENIAHNGPYVAVTFGITSGLFLAGLKPLLMLRDLGRFWNRKEDQYLS